MTTNINNELRQPTCQSLASETKPPFVTEYEWATGEKQ
jgi:hypothetical protein